MEPPPIRRPPQTTGPAPPKTYSAPRRFGIGALLGVATACAVLIWCLPVLNTPPPVIIAISVFLAIVAGVQAVFKESLRWASIIAGEVCAVGCFTYITVVQVVRGVNPILCGVVPFVLLLGLIAGYCGGAMVAGFFLVTENAAKYFARGEEKGASETPSIWDAEND